MTKHQPLDVLLPLYTLDSALVLLPGILYSVSFPRYKAAAFLARYREKIGNIAVVKSLLSEYEFNNPESEIPVLSPDVAAGITKFHQTQASNQYRLLDSTAAPQTDLDWLIVAIWPNFSKISYVESVVTSPDEGTAERVATVCRVVGITDDSHTIKITLQAIVRATRSVNSELKPSVCEFTVDFSGNSFNSSSNEKEVTVLGTQLKEYTSGLFRLVDKFIEGYRQALAVLDQEKPDLVTLNPLANALFLQLAGLKDFARAYATLQKIQGSRSATDLARGLLRLIDLTVAILPFPNTEKLKVLQSSSLAERAHETNRMVEKLATVFETIRENSAMANHWFHREATSIQKANLVANQLKSIRVVLEGLTGKEKPSLAKQKQLVKRGNGPVLLPSKPPAGSSLVGNGNSGDGHDEDDEDDEDDLRLVTDFIKNQLPKITSISDDSKRLLVKDYRRVKSSPPTNADFHVIRNYLEIVSDMPWDKYVARFKSNKDIDLDVAKAQLDADHHGLQHVKTRLIQYLVVLKLLGANAEREYVESGMKDADEKRHLKEKMETVKFTRESANGESIIVPSHDDTQASRGEPKTSQKDLADIGEKSPESVEKASYQESLLASKNNKSPIIMLAGPPGVGKTSLAKSIATTLGRKFQRISLGGVKDESEIRGHRRTYVGAMAGSIVQALRKSRSMNPVILLDEIDKVVGGHNSGNKTNGDPAAALLEVLDPEQNTQFTDHFLGFPIDLSQVIFICTANDPHTLSRPLLDRLEMINVGAYDYDEKLVIGNKYLLPRQMRRNGFSDESMVVIKEDVMKKVILDYTREAGVRNLERSLGTICRFKAVEYSEALANENQKYHPKVEEFDLARYLGLPYPSSSNEIVELPLMSSRYGVANGMSYNTDGSGSVLIFESIGFKNEKAGTSLHMTGRLGEVLLESAKIGLTFIKNMLYKRLLNLDDPESYLKKLNSLEIHMHVPSGAVQKDGPSAGITMALLFLSLILKKPVPASIAMTGEITLRGLVLPIGGLKEKILGAHLTGQIKKVIVPRQNRRDVLEEYVHKINDSGRLNGLLKDNQRADFKDFSPENYFEEKYGIQIVYAKEFWDVIKHVWGDELLAKVEHCRLEEYHL